MPSILVATGFVRIDSDTKPALKALKAFGAVGAQALSTTLLPASAAVTTAIGAIASSAAVAGAAFTAYGVAVQQQFSQISDASKKQTAAEDAKTKATNATVIAQRLAKEGGFEYGKAVKITADMTDAARARAENYNSALSQSKSAVKAATLAQQTYKAQLASMPPATAKTAEALQNLKSATKSWSDSLAPQTMPVFTRAIEFLTRLLPKLSPIVRNVSVQISAFVDSLGEGTAGRVFKEFGKNVQLHAGGAVKAFLDIARNIVVGIGGILNAFMPMSQQVTGGLAGLTEKFAEFGANLGGSKGFATFIKTAQDAGPRLAAVFTALADALTKVASAAGPLSGIGLKVLEIFANIVNAIPTPVLRLLVPAIIAVNLALKAWAIYSAGAAAATWLFSTAVTTSTGVTYASRISLIGASLAMGAFRVATFLSYLATKLHAVATGIATAATTAWTFATTVATTVLTAMRTAILFTAGAFRALAIAIISNPIGLIITLLVALGVAFFLLWKKSETFRNIVKGSLNAVKDAALAVAHWFAGPFVNFMKMAWDLVYKVLIQPWVIAFTVWIPAAVRFMYNAVSALIRITMAGLKAAWDFVYKWALRPWVVVFTQTIPNAARSLWSGVTRLWNATVQGLMAGYGVIRDRVFSPIGTFFTKTIPGWARSLRDSVVGFFRGMRDGIGTVWDGIRAKTKAPINWVLDHVWNRGIVSVWGSITKWIGIGNALHPVKLLASGGTVGRSGMGVFNRPTAIVGEGNPAHPEFVIPTDPKYRSRAYALWQAAGTHFMKDGGIIGSIGSAIKSVGSAVASGVKGAVDFLTDPVGKAKSLLSGTTRGMSSLGSSPWVKAITSLPGKAIDGLISAVKKIGGSVLGAVGLGPSAGSGVQRWSGVVLQALRMVGQVPGLLNITLRRMQQESGGNPNIVNKWDSNWKRGTPSVGLMQVIGPTFRSYAGSMRNVGPFLYGVSVNPLANVYASMRYALAAYGSLARAYGRPGGYRNGTTSAAGGLHLFGEAGPELGVSPAGWRILTARRTAGAFGGGLTIQNLVLENHGVIGSQYEVENWLVESLESLKRKGRI